MASFFITVALNALNWCRADMSLHNLAGVFLFNKTKFWEEAILFRAHPQYYVPGWTLVIELTISLFVPFMIVLARKDMRLIYWLLAFFLIIGPNMGDWYMFHFHFALGILLSCFFFRLQAPSFKHTRWYQYRYPLLALAFILYSLRHIDRLYPFGQHYNYMARYAGVDLFHYTGIASFVFIAAIIASPRAQTLLRHRLLRFFGKISYGIYLMHWLLVTDIFIYWSNLAAFFPGKKIAFAAIFLLYAAATVLLATILHYTIELPFMRLGKRISRRMRPSLQVD